MKRRNFIKTTSAASIPLLFNGIPVIASSQIESTALEKMARSAADCGRILVIIQQNGGNDGLNTVFPLDKWSELSNARSNILMDETKVLKLNGNTTTGLHPAMPEMQNLYNDGKMMIIQGVSYPNPSLSHFRATDIWFTGSDSSSFLDTGWMGRALGMKYPEYPIGYPNSDMPDPLAVQIGSLLPFSLQGENVQMGYNVTNPTSLINVINQVTDPVQDTDYGLELKFLRLMLDQSNAYRLSLQDAYNTPSSSSVVYPTGNALADQLKIVAKLINGGLKTPIYILNHPNTHDTHDTQVDITDKTIGRQATNLTILSQAIGAFQKDLEETGKADIVAGMTFSEFGRRIISNDSLGTDHGSAAPVMFFGTKLNTSPSVVANTQNPVAGMIGTSPNLPAAATVSDLVPMQFDYRQIYSTVMQDWLCMSEAEVKQVFGGVTFARLPVFTNTPLSSIDFEEEQNQAITIYPNPCLDGLINLKFPSPSSDYTNVSLLSVNGTLLQSSNHQLSGQELKLQYNGLSSNSVYILNIEWRGRSFYKKVLTK